MTHRKLSTYALLLFLLAAALVSRADDAAGQNTARARAALDAMVQALGGEAWLHQKTSMRKGRLASFYQGKPNVGTTLYWEFQAWPERNRIEITKHRDVVELFVGREGWEVTYKGKTALPADQVEEYLRRRDHSIETVVHNWLPDAKTILLYEGQHMVERHLADQITLISPSNDSVTILLDTQTHLPLRRSFQWRDPVYKDKNTDAEEYDDYHAVSGIPTPYSVTRFKNDEMTSQRFLYEAAYNLDEPESFWSADEAEKLIKKQK
jgi:hypothetical protein